MTDTLPILAGSVHRLAALAGGLDDDQIVLQAYPTEWTVADVLSHLGSGAVILRRRLEDTLAGRPTPDDAATTVWAEWDAKAPRAQADDALVADRALLVRLEEVTAEERDGFVFTMGPMSLDFDACVALRLNEHALHVWDIEVVLDPEATVAPDSVARVVDNLQMFAGFTGRPTDGPRVVTVGTTDPARTFRITLGPERVSIDDADPGDEAELVMPAEALVRLVYGRLDPDHTPPISGSGDLAELRQAFPGA